MNGREIKKIRGELITKYGAEYCMLCYKTPEQTGEEHLHIHEMRYERPPLSSNCLFLCRSCNKKEELRKSQIEKTQDISAAQKTAQIAYPLFIRWLDGEINKPENNYHLDYDLVITQGAYEIGMRVQNYPLSTVTIERQLKPLCDHPTSPYITRADNYGHMQIWVRGKEPRDTTQTTFIE